MHAFDISHLYNLGEMVLQNISADPQPSLHPSELQTKTHFVDYGVIFSI